MKIEFYALLHVACKRTLGVILPRMKEFHNILLRSPNVSGILYKSSFTLFIYIYIYIYIYMYMYVSLYR